MNKRVTIVAGMLMSAAATAGGGAPVSSMAFPKAENLLHTKLYRAWKAPLYLRADHPESAEFRPSDAFAEGAKPWLHFVVANFGRRAETFTGIRMEVLDVCGGVVLAARNAVYNEVFEPGNVRYYALSDANWRTLKPGRYTLRARVNPGCREIPGVDAVACWPFRVVPARTPPPDDAPPDGPGPLRRPEAFVLMDRERTGLPVLSCRIPRGCVAAGRAIWAQRQFLEPFRYQVQAVDPRCGTQVSLISDFAVQPQNMMATPAQARAEIYAPPALAARIASVLCGGYGLQNLRLESARVVPGDEARGRALLAECLAAARKTPNVRLTQYDIRKLAFRYSGLRHGQPRVVNAECWYFFHEVGQRFCTGVALEVATCCSSPDGERPAVARLREMADSRVVNPVFLHGLDEIVRRPAQAWIEGNNRQAAEMMRINRDLEASLAAGRAASRYGADVRSRAVERFCDAIRGEERVVNPANGRETRVSTAYDHCFLSADGEALYWNNDGEMSGFDPNENPHFNHTTWRSVR